MTAGDAPPGMDRTSLRNVQYRTDSNLAARQSLYIYQQPRLELQPLVLALADLDGNEIVADIGCGNGLYLAELERQRHSGPMLGADISAGMLRAARTMAPRAALAAGDAAALPLRDSAAEVTLAAHMLYHVPNPPDAVRELRRITRPGGRVLVVLNAADHLCEMRDIINAALSDAGAHSGRRVRERLHLDQGADLLASVFTSVTRHDFTAELLIPGTAPVKDYVRSMAIIQALPDPEALVTAVARRIPAGADGTFRVRAHSGCLACS